MKSNKLNVFLLYIGFSTYSLRKSIFLNKQIFLRGDLPTIDKATYNRYPLIKNTNEYKIINLI